MTIRLNIRPTPPPTYLGWPRRTAVGLALALAAAGAAIGLALPTPTACTVVEDGPTGPEAGVTLGVMVIACPDGRYAVTYVLADPAEVVDVQAIRPPVEVNR